jgi:hypothetical protein
MGLNVDLTRMIGAPKEKTCPKCGHVSPTRCDEYDIECGGCNPERGKWVLMMYCGECDHEWNVEFRIELTQIGQMTPAETALEASLNALTRLVREDLPGYPEEGMMIAPDLSVADARALIGKKS